jgi:NAD(P)H-dependent FMN reductase
MASIETADVLALQGSPRAGGNSDDLLEAFLKPAEERGLEVARVRISRLDFKPCLGCHFCETHGECVQKDSMQDFYAPLLSARWIVLSTPIFFYNVPGRTKSFIDRCQALWARKYMVPGGGGPLPISEPGRRGICLAAGATRGKNLFRGLGWTTRYFFDAVDVSDEGVYGVRNLENKGDARTHPDALPGAQARGREFFTDHDA